MVFLLCSSGVLIKTRGNVQGPLCVCKNQKMKNEKKDKSGEMATLITVCVCVCVCVYVCVGACVCVYALRNGHSIYAYICIVYVLYNIYI